jgi:hypothetical protein
VGAWIVDSVIVLAPAVVLFTSDLEYLEERDLDQSGVDFCEDFMDQEEGVCVDAGDRVYFSDGLPVSPWLVALGMSILIYVVIQGLRGWTPGKLLFGIRTVAEDGQPPGIGRAIIRWVLFIVDGLCAGLVGFIVMLTSRGHRRVGDMAAKTYVVGSQYAGHPIAVPGMASSYAAAPGYPGAPGAGWGAPPGPPPGEQPPTWAPPPAWGPAPTWGAPPPETTRPQTPTPPTDTPAGGSAPSPSEEAAPAPEAAPAEEADTAAETPGEAPGTTEEPQPEAATAESGTPPGYNPQWDPARGTYIVWSPERGHWLGWDDAAKEWKAL